MCGFAGIVNSSAPFDASALDEAIGRIQHRGPLETRHWKEEDRGVYFAHCRLSIIDLTSAAAQPMHYAGRFVVVYNGEIYNYRELKQELISSGHQFQSDSDTEVLLAAYAHWGRDCLQHLDGMFAFAIWDKKEHCLFAARDRFGEKPFYYHYDGSRFLFASEIKSLWSLNVPRRVNLAMAYNFLSFDYTSNPADLSETFFEGISKLPPASFLEFRPSQSEPLVSTYWQLSMNPHPRDDRQAIEEFTSLLEESVRKRLRSDVPIGTSLSGGLDSSTIVAVASRYNADQYAHKAFTASFPGTDKDELPLASEVAKRFNLSHFITEVDAHEVVSLMSRLMSIQDEPFTSSSVLAQYKVFELAAREGVTVMLDGQGADETLGGYHQYYRWYWRELYAKPGFKKGGELQKARDLGIHESFSWKDRVAALLPETTAAIWQSRKISQAFRHPDYERDFAFAHRQSAYYTLPPHQTLNGILFHHTTQGSLEELLRLADRNSMSKSLEVRLPFLSHELVEFLFTLPPSFKIRDGWTKWILRKAMENRLPSSVAWRKDKLGYEPPQLKWMQQPEVQDAIREGKLRLASAGLITKQAAAKKIQPHEAYAADHREWKYWSLSYLFP